MVGKVKYLALGQDFMVCYAKTQSGIDTCVSALVCSLKFH